MIDKAAETYRKAVVRWVDAVRRMAWLVVIVAVLASAASLIYTAGNLGINTDTTDMLSRRLPFRQTYEHFKEAFPQFTDAILVVVDGENMDLADDAAAALADRLEERSDLFNTVYYPAGDPFFIKNGPLYLDLEELYDLSDRLAGAQPLLTTLAEDLSLRGLFDTLGLAIDDILDGEEPAGDLDTVFDNITDTVEGQLQGRARPLSWQELMRGREVEPGDRRRFILVQPVLDFESLQPAAAAMASIRSLARELELDDEHGVRVRLTGSAAIANEELESVRASASVAGMLSLVLVGSLLFIGLRSARLVFATLATLLMGLAWTAAFATLAIGHLNLISVAFAVLFIGLAVDFGIHFGLRYKEEIDGGQDHGEALRRAAASVGGALTLCAVAAALGFYSFLPTAYTGLSELGLISGTGMFIALFANLTLLPALLTLLPLRPARRAPASALPLRAQAYIQRHAKAIVAGAAVLAVATVPLLPQARFDFDPLHLKDPTKESVQTVLELIADSSTGADTAAIIADDLEAARRLVARLEALDLVDRAVMLLDYVPSDQEEKLDVIDGMTLFLMPLLEPAPPVDPPDEAERRAALALFLGKLDQLLSAGEAAALAPSARRLSEALARFEAGASDRAFLELETDLVSTLPKRLADLRLALTTSGVTLADLPEDLRQRQITADGRVRIEVFPREDINDNEALRRFVTAVRTVAPDATDSPVILLEAGDTVVAAFQQATITALALIALLLVVLLRGVSGLLLVMAPLALAASLTVATSVVLGLPLNFANVIVLPLLLGLGVASGIHLVMRERGEAGAITRRWTSTPRAVVFSALTTIGSFGSLSVSSHRGMASMGELLTIAITFTLICTVIVLPALMGLMAQAARHKPA